MHAVRSQCSRAHTTAVSTARLCASHPPTSRNPCPAALKTAPRLLLCALRLRTRAAVALTRAFASVQAPHLQEHLPASHPSHPETGPPKPQAADWRLQAPHLQERFACLAMPGRRACRCRCTTRHPAVHSSDRVACRGMIERGEGCG
eukprot:354385-Chlamydomonas_euryale.AAC.2